MSKIMHMDTQFAGVTPEKDFSELVDFFYPVGCYFETSDTTFNPNVSWSGTWVLETEGLVHISSGSNYTVSGALTDTKDGGSKDAIIPYHNHTASGGSVSNQAAFTSGGGGYHNHSFVRITTNKQANSSAATTYSPQTSGGSTSDYSTSYASEHTHTIPEHGHGFTNPSISYAGTNGNTTNANMQPYIIVNRWHRTA